MAIGKHPKGFPGGESPDESPKADLYVELQKQGARGALAFSQQRVVVITLNEDLLDFLFKRLKGPVEAKGYEYDDDSSMDLAINSQIIILDVTPKVDARLHGKYDSLVRMKKSLGKKEDVTCVIGWREHYKKYPRGTYPGLLYFCIEGDNFDHREPDLPPEGTDTIEGPRLYNFADITEAILAFIAAQPK